MFEKAQHLGMPKGNSWVVSQCPHRYEGRELCFRGSVRTYETAELYSENNEKIIN